MSYIKVVYVELGMTALAATQDCIKKKLEISNLERFNLRDCVYCLGCGKPVSYSIILYQSGYFPFKLVGKLLIDNEGGQVVLCETRQISAAEMRASGILKEQLELSSLLSVLCFCPSTMCATPGVCLLVSHTISRVENTSKMNYFNEC